MTVTDHVQATVILQPELYQWLREEAFNREVNQSRIVGKPWRMNGKVG